MRNTTISLIFSFLLFVCAYVDLPIDKAPCISPKSNPFVGAWLLDHVSQLDSSGESQIVAIFKKGLIMYSADGYMSAILTYSDTHPETPGLDVGYCGKYELNLDEGFVNHLRDVIAINADSENEIFTRDYIISDEGKYLTLSPREAKWKGTSLTWKRVD